MDGTKQDIQWTQPFEYTLCIFFPLTHTHTKWLSDVHWANGPHLTGAHWGIQSGSILLNGSVTNYVYMLVVIEVLAVNSHSPNILLIDSITSATWKLLKESHVSFFPNWLHNVEKQHSPNELSYRAERLKPPTVDEIHNWHWKSATYSAMKEKEVPSNNEELTMQEEMTYHWLLMVIAKSLRNVWRGYALFLLDCPLQESWCCPQ